MIPHRNKVFFDSEFTELSEKAELLSLGFISETNATFYAEFTDYSENKVNDWVRTHVIGNFTMLDQSPGYVKTFTNGDDKNYSIELKGDSSLIKSSLIMWLHQFGEVELWSDCLAYDWMLLNKLFGETALDVPKGVYHYIPLDISTLFYAKGIDPDINREKFADFKGDESNKHNALHDSIMIKKCFYKLIKK